MVYSQLLAKEEIFVQDKNNIVWQFPSALHTSDQFNEEIPEVTFEKDFEFNQIKLDIRKAPTEQTVQDSVTVAILKNDVQITSASIATNSKSTKVTVGPFTILGASDNPTADRLRLKITRVGQTRPGTGLTVNLRSPLV